MALGVVDVSRNVGHAAGQPQISDVQLGFGGRYKVGCWTPVLVTLTGGTDPISAKLRLVTLDGDGTNVAYESSGKNLSIAPGKVLQVIRYVKFGRVQASLRIDLVNEDQTYASRELSSGEFPLPLITTRRLIVTLGESRILDDATRRRISGRENLSFASLDTAHSLPEKWIGYEGLDTLVVTTAENELLDQISPQQLVALERWVRLGGRMILSVGARGHEVFEGQRRGMTQLARFCPGTFVDVTALRSAAALESFSGASQRLDLGRGRDAGIPMTVLKDVRGQIEVSERGIQGLQPLVVRSPYGFGQIVFVAIDLDGPKLRDWTGRSRLTSRVLRGSRQDVASVGEEPVSRRVAHVGYQDLVGQLRSSLDRFSGVMVVPFFWVAGLVLVYVLLIGPGDYLLLTRFVGRMPWTWVTFPLISLLFCGLAWFLYHQLKEDRVRINQIDLVDVDAESSLVRGSMWAHVYSPATKTYNFSLEQASFARPLNIQPPEMVLSWHGLPGKGLGGLNTTSKATSFAPEYRVSMNADITDTPIQVTSTKALMGRWWGKANLAGTAHLEADTDGLLQGEVVNPLPCELTDCVVLFANWMYRLDAVSGTLAPGETTSVHNENPLNLEWRLTRRRVLEAEDVHVPWNQTNLDIPEILEIMMFHDAAGGDGYTRLTHRYQPFVDLSHQLNSGRAILFGRCETPATELTTDEPAARDAYDRRWTFCRVLFPVENWRREEAVARSLSASNDE